MASKSLFKIPGALKENGLTKVSRTGMLFGLLLLLVAGLFLLDILLGSVRIPVTRILEMFSGAFQGKEEWQIIVFDYRLPRAITALLAGSALAVSGLQMQTLFRNPLAGPYVLGISSGASLGVALLVLGLSTSTLAMSVELLGNWAIVMAATIGAGLILLLILAVSLRIRDGLTILILGILFGSIATAIITILQYFSNESMLKSFIVWTMGSLGNVSHNQLSVLLITVFSGLLIAAALIKILNVLLLGEDYARTLGLNVILGRVLIFLSTSILAGGITAFCGPIGFIGIVVPHLGRMLFRTARHEILLPGVLLIGMAFMLLSDILSHLPGYENILPINSVTALLGIPVIIWIVIRRKELTPVG